MHYLTILYNNIKTPAAISAILSLLWGKVPGVSEEESGLSLFLVNNTSFHPMMYLLPFIRRFLVVSDCIKLLSIIDALKISPLFYIALITVKPYSHTGAPVWHLTLTNPHLSDAYGI